MNHSEMRSALFIGYWQFIFLVLLLQTAQSAQKPPDVSWDEFKNAVKKNGFPTPKRDQYDGFVRSLGDAGIKDKREAAMYLAQMIHESGGFRHKENQDYMRHKGSKSYADRHRYHARGYIQLTGKENYQHASEDIYGDQRLVRNPDLVARNEAAAFSTSSWYWRNRVAVKPEVRRGWFGAATKAINGGVECHGKNIRSSKKRYKYYKQTYNYFGLPGIPDERGCYN